MSRLGSKVRAFRLRQRLTQANLAERLGAAGVTRMLQTIREEIEVAMALAGVTSVSVIDRTLLV